MNSQNWLTLMEYSQKHSISLSTLRRRLKTHPLQFRYDNGKYFIQDGPLERLQSRSSQVLSPVVNVAPPQKVNQSSHDQGELLVQQAGLMREQKVLELVQNLLNEIKSQFEKNLMEKEKKISELSKEIVNLQTLIKVLEDSGSLKEEKKKQNKPSLSSDKKEAQSSIQETLDDWLVKLNEG